MTYMAFPFRVTADGRTASVDWPAHVRDMVELVALTVLGERANQPDFGSNAPGLVFEGAAEELAITSLYLIRAALTQWLAEVITVLDVTLEASAGAIEITVTYQLGLDPAPVVQVIAAESQA